ncbi:MAG: hypothetical protein COZ31_11545 [Nitrospirae bacterium CG_4_10_14_3_um_filter_44_29]|nr:hypothetical protein [Nitrospirota bacterium]OIO30303.1 MAG: hypothetical protein AUJ60_03125 [Nitrospirae bacterium CG1_02_44_142]PIV40240.1 MAG: hypothetical protein COS28_09900 [Nitrospirae bacterium CG02_land_8_20_14_3_00_44_33]PIV66156.1 MAG: hypothetical protein COS10_07710 [Nitrospirae bacterium CG01_land_8_20_14_3_00_44_22]PIW90594.1 MAG: hypothetical protein COZ93_01040 [Nitrospirae bacterium CG_4_8_14_3_um_filter_44_28]PIX87225.1 MAG: hypothetical protein COZ31_11545 [Nitrospirae 
MKKILLILAVLSFLASCDEKPRNPVSEYGNAMLDSYKKAQKAGEAANLDAVKKAVQAYHALNDKYPRSLDDVKGLIGAEMDMSKYSYDPQTGTVSIRNN